MSFLNIDLKIQLCYNQIEVIDCVPGFHDLSGSICKLGDIFCEENVQLAKKSIKAF